MELHTSVPGAPSSWSGPPRESVLADAPTEIAHMREDQLGLSAGGSRLLMSTVSSPQDHDQEGSKAGRVMSKLSFGTYTDSSDDGPRPLAESSESETDKQYDSSDHGGVFEKLRLLLVRFRSLRGTRGGRSDACRGSKFHRDCFRWRRLLQVRLVEAFSPISFLVALPVSVCAGVLVPKILWFILTHCRMFKIVAVRPTVTNFKMEFYMWARACE